MKKEKERKKETKRKGEKEKEKKKKTRRDFYPGVSYKRERSLYTRRLLSGITGPARVREQISTAIYGSKFVPDEAATGIAIAVEGSLNETPASKAGRGVRG